MNGQNKGFSGNYIIVAVQPQEIPAETKKKLLAAWRMLYFRLGECFNHLIVVGCTVSVLQENDQHNAASILGENAHAEFT